MPAGDPEAEDGELRVRVVAGAAEADHDVVILLAVGGGFALHDAVHVVLERLVQRRRLLPHRLFRLDRFLEDRRRRLALNVGETARLARLRPRARISPAAGLGDLTAQQTHAHRLDQGQVVGVAEAVEEHDRQGQGIGVGQFDALLPQVHRDALDDRIVGGDAALQQGKAGKGGDTGVMSALSATGGTGVPAVVQLLDRFDAALDGLPHGGVFLGGGARRGDEAQRDDEGAAHEHPASHG